MFVAPTVLVWVCVCVLVCVLVVVVCVICVCMGNRVRKLSPCINCLWKWFLALWALILLALVFWDFVATFGCKFSPAKSWQVLASPAGKTILKNYRALYLRVTFNYFQEGQH